MQPCHTPLEVYEDNPLREKYPFAFNENTSRYFIHDAFHTATWMWQFSHAHVSMNPIDLAALGIADHDHVRVFNDRGEFGCEVRANNAVRPGTVHAWQATRCDRARYTPGKPSIPVTWTSEALVACSKTSSSPGAFCGARIGRLYEGQPLIMCGRKTCVKEVLSHERKACA